MYKEKKHPLSLGLDHPSVQQVIDVALELTNEHKLNNTELLYNRAKKTLIIPEGGLKTIIQMLINRKILIDGSKFTKETNLKNKFRLFIYRTIKRNIGIYFSFLKVIFSHYRENKMGVGHLVWHLEKLITFNLIKKIKLNKYTIFLPVEVSDEAGILYFILRDDLNRNIVRVILEKKAMNRADNYKELDIERDKTYYSIKKMIGFDLLTTLLEDEKSISINSSKRDLIRHVISNISTKKQNNKKIKHISMNI